MNNSMPSTTFLSFRARPQVLRRKLFACPNPSNHGLARDHGADLYGFVLNATSSEAGTRFTLGDVH